MILSVHTCTGNSMYSSWNYSIMIMFFTVKARLPPSLLGSLLAKHFMILLHFKAFTTNCLHVNASIVPRHFKRCCLVAPANGSIKLEMLKFIPSFMAIPMLLHINAQHFNCRLLQEDTLWTRVIYLINDMIFDDSIIFVQVMLVQLQIGVQQVGHCEYKHNMYIHRHTYVHAHTSTPHKLKI